MLQYGNDRGIVRGAEAGVAEREGLGVLEIELGLRDLVHGLELEDLMFRGDGAVQVLACEEQLALLYPERLQLLGGQDVREARRGPIAGIAGFALHVIACVFRQLRIDLVDDE